MRVADTLVNDRAVELVCQRLKNLCSLTIKDNKLTPQGKARIVDIYKGKFIV